MPVSMSMLPVLAGPEDAAPLAVLRFEQRAELAAAVGDPIEERGAFLSRCEDWMASRLGEVPSGPERWKAWLVREAGEAVGGVWAQIVDKVPNPVPESERLGYVTNLYVRPTFRGGGAGARLAAAAVAWCEALAVAEVLVWPSSGSLRIWRRLGFVPSADVMRRVSSDGAPRISCRC